MNAEFIQALDALEEEKGINKEELIQAIEASIESAYRKNYGGAQAVEVNFDRISGEIKVFTSWHVVDIVEDAETEKSIDEAREIDPDIQVGEICKIEIAPKDFGRIAAQNAKQLIFQRIKEAERNIVYNEFLERQDEVVTGLITRIERGVVYVDIGDGEGVMLPSEQIESEHYKVGQRIKVYMLMVKKTTKGPQITLSRTHPGLVKRLFESEVPEIYDGVVDIIGIAREAGSRTKIAMRANDENVDPVGSCVGYKGVRVQNIITELNGEKIDVIKFSDDICEFIANALSPAKVEEVLANKTEKMAYAVVDDFQFSLAIGKEGQNVRLAAKLTGWKIDIKSVSDFQKMLEENPDLRNEFTKEEKETESLIGEIKKEMDEVLKDDAGSGVLEEKDELSFDDFDMIDDESLEDVIKMDD
ncbi:MAG: transcription termination factor NusA [Eubacteriaceae bacterium]|nr:transcription termination factor NusA [Eubacteriaceae bacterium]MDD4508200.1 transcription termination factor NusA [Eubacteriaceae bacterium]